jgi:diguanylate cyclase (GGDEF)-like protein
MLRATAQVTIRDALTGLYNRRHFEERLAHEVERARRHGAPLSLLFVDIDNFTGINDSLGADGGDRILAALGHLFHATSRASDVVARWTGEKFAFLLPNTDHEGALIAAERARTVVASHLFPRRRRLAVSVGVATMPRDAADGQRLVAQADIALYLAKSSGKNRASACPRVGSRGAEAVPA